MKLPAWLTRLLVRAPQEQWQARFSGWPPDLDRNTERRIRKAIENRLRGRSVGRST
jgi:hypothetical protein